MINNKSNKQTKRFNNMKQVQVIVKEVVIKSINVEVPENTQDVNAYCWDRVMEDWQANDDGELKGHAMSQKVEFVKVEENEG